MNWPIVDRALPGYSEIPASRVWRLVSPVFVALFLIAVVYVALRMLSPGVVFHYPEASVFGSLAAFDGNHELSTLYPADGWVRPPLVLTLYPPLFFYLSAGVDAVFGTGGTLLAPRIITSLALLAVLVWLFCLGNERGVPRAWWLCLAGAALITPAFWGLAGGAQVDLLALAFTAAGIRSALPVVEGAIRGGRSGGNSLGKEVEGFPYASLGWFLLAVFTKQSYISAPLALVAVLAIDRRWRAAAVFGAALGLSIAGGAMLLNHLTDGGYLLNSLGALGTATSFRKLVLVLWATAPYQWIPLLLVVGFAVYGSLRLRFAEFYLLATALLHIASMARIGSGASYLLEPLFALLLLAILRCPEMSGWRPGGIARPIWILGLMLTIPASMAGVHRAYELRELVTMRGTSIAQELPLGGYPLVSAAFFPATVQRGQKPYLNDPFAFGSLYEAGLWDIAPLVQDLQNHCVPFAISHVAPATRAPAAGSGTLELGHAYFWTIPPLRRALIGSYEPVDYGGAYLWLSESAGAAGNDGVGLGCAASHRPE